MGLHYDAAIAFMCVIHISFGTNLGPAPDCTMLTGKRTHCSCRYRDLSVTAFSFMNDVPSTDQWNFKSSPWKFAIKAAEN